MKAFLASSLLLLLASCATHHPNLGKTALNTQILSGSTEHGKDNVWQTQHLEIIYRVVEAGDTFTVTGTLNISDSITNSFPTTKYFQLQINYLDESNRVMSSHDIAPNMGYKNSIPKELGITGVADAPKGAVAFAFSYWGIFSGMGIQDENTGDWEVHFDPFVNGDNRENPKQHGLFISE